MCNINLENYLYNEHEQTASTPTMSPFTSHMKAVKLSLLPFALLSQYCLSKVALLGLVLAGQYLSLSKNPTSVKNGAHLTSREFEFPPISLQHVTTLTPKLTW